LLVVEQDRVMKVVAVELVDIVHLFQVVENYFYNQDLTRSQLVQVDQDLQVLRLHHVLMEVYHQSLI
tara:strand:+ start:488 stop:688 length:201 start_codon:yes stop_codon:yes gene_type:complete